MPLFTAFVLGIALVVIFNQRKYNQAYKVDWMKITEVKGIVALRLKDHFVSNPVIELSVLKQICQVYSLEHNVSIFVSKKGDHYDIVFKRGRARDKFSISKSVVL